MSAAPETFDPLMRSCNKQLSAWERELMAEDNPHSLMLYPDELTKQGRLPPLDPFDPALTPAKGYGHFAESTEDQHDQYLKGYARQDRAVTIAPRIEATRADFTRFFEVQGNPSGISALIKEGWLSANDGSWRQEGFWPFPEPFNNPLMTPDQIQENWRGRVWTPRGRPKHMPDVLSGVMVSERVLDVFRAFDPSAFFAMPQIIRFKDGTEPPHQYFWFDVLRAIWGIDVRRSTLVFAPGWADRRIRPPPLQWLTGRYGSGDRAGMESVAIREDLPSDCHMFRALTCMRPSPVPKENVHQNGPWYYSLTANGLYFSADLLAALKALKPKARGLFLRHPTDSFLNLKPI